MTVTPIFGEFVSNDQLIRTLIEMLNVHDTDHKFKCHPLDEDVCYVCLIINEGSLTWRKTTVFLELLSAGCIADFQDIVFVGYALSRWLGYPYFCPVVMLDKYRAWYEPIETDFLEPALALAV
jgi:hypothetical protein